MRGSPRWSVAAQTGVRRLQEGEADGKSPSILQTSGEAETLHVLQRFDRHGAVLHDLDSELMTVDQADAQEGLGLSRGHVDGQGLAVPDDHRRVEVERLVGSGTLASRLLKTPAIIPPAPR